MISSQAVKRALRTNALALPTRPRIVGVKGYESEDSSGEESLEIFVLFDNRTRDEDIENAPIDEIKLKIMDSLARNKVALFPYFTFLREKELTPPDVEE